MRIVDEESLSNLYLALLPEPSSKTGLTLRLHQIRVVEIVLGIDCQRKNCISKFIL